MISHTLEMRPLLRIKVKEQDLIQDELFQKTELLLESEPNNFDLEYYEFMNSIKTAFYFQAWINEKDEDYLLENFNIRPGEIRIKLEIADWLLYASEELSVILNQKENQKENHKDNQKDNEKNKLKDDYKHTIKEIKKLRIRVKKGVKEELLPLLKIKGIGRVRARKLFTQGIKDLNNLKNTDLTSLSQVIGKNTASNIKNQLGEEVKEIPKGTRKGQLSLMKF